MEDNKILGLIKTKRENAYSDYIFKTNLIKTIDVRNSTYGKIKNDIKKLKITLSTYDDLINTIHLKNNAT